MDKEALVKFPLPVLQFSPVSIIPPLLHTHIHLPPMLYNVFLPILQFSPVSIIPPLLHTHSFIYHPHCVMFFSQHFSFPLSVSFHHCSYSFIYLPPTLQYIFLPILQFSPVSTIPPMLHTHSFTYHPHYIMFLSQYFSFTLSVPFHQFVYQALTLYDLSN